MERKGSRIGQIRRAKTPTVIQMEAVECGAAALGIVLGYFGRHVPLEELRVACGVSRDGSTASHMVGAAESYGLKVKAFSMETEQLRDFQAPMILFWKFCHFLVLEGAKKGKVYLNDPAIGPYVLEEEEFDRHFTGVVLTFEPGESFKAKNEKPSFWGGIQSRLKHGFSPMLFAVLAGLGLVLPGLVTPFFIKIFVDEVLIREMTHWMTPLLIGMAVTLVLQAGFYWLRGQALLMVETAMALTESGRFFWHIFQLPMTFFVQRMAGDIENRVALNDRVANLLTRKLIGTLLHLFTAVFFLVVMLMFDWVLTLAGFLTALINILILNWFSRRRHNQNIKLRHDSGQLHGVGVNGILSIETVKASGAEGDFFRRWTGYFTKVVHSWQELDLSTYRMLLTPPLLHAMIAGLVLCLGAIRVINGQMTMGSLFAFLALMNSFLDPVNQLVRLGADLQTTESDMARLSDVTHYDQDPLVQEKVGLNTGQTPKLNGRLQFDQVTFGYSALAEPLIRDFSLKVEPGMRVALVGKSGSGKSTIARLASGLYQPWSGKIYYDGLEAQEIPRTVLTQSLAMVDQDIFLFEGSIRHNLSLWDDTITEPQLVRAARDAQIHDDIASRPGSYDSLVAENGSNFSGGQRQRLEIARALVGNPSILILDEAISALDPTTEKQIDENLRRRGCACLIVAHRLSTIRDCDEIIVMDGGCVAERGTHETLLAKKGMYAQLVRDL